MILNGFMILNDFMILDGFRPVRFGWRDIYSGLCNTRLDVTRTARVSLLVQPAEEWRATPVTADVFYSEEPEYIDITSLGPFAAVETSLTKWSHTTSDTHGCWELSNPVHSEPPQALMDRNVPVLCLLHELSRRGWISANATIVHERPLALLYDRRSVKSKRSYLQVSWKYCTWKQCK